MENMEMKEKKLIHGRPRNYNSGTCRCEICTEAWRKYTAPYRKAYEQRLKLKRQEAS